MHEKRRKNTRKKGKTIKTSSIERAGNADKGDVFRVPDRNSEEEKNRRGGGRWIKGGAGRRTEGKQSPEERRRGRTPKQNRP